MDSLHMEYEIAHQLLQLYLYINREVAQAALHNSAENLAHVRPVLDELLKAYMLWLKFRLH